MGRGSNGHEQCVTRYSFSRLVHSPGSPASVITWTIAIRDTGIPANRAGSVVLYNRIVDFCCVWLRCRDLCKASQPGSCKTPIFQSPRAHTQNFSLPCNNYNNNRSLFHKVNRRIPCYKNVNVKSKPRYMKWQLKSNKIGIGNSMIWSDIWHKYHECYT